MSFERKLIVRPRADLSSKISQVFSSFLSSIILSTWAYTSNEVSLQFDSSSAVSLDHFKVYTFHLLLKILMKKTCKLIRTIETVCIFLVKLR